MSSTSQLLCLPKELRYEIYDRLCRQEPKSYPFRQPPISSIDRRGPPTELLLTCRYLCEDVQAYFYRTVAFTLVAQDVQRRDVDSASLNAIRHARKIELRLSWYLRSGCAETDMSGWPYSMNGWLFNMVNLLLGEARSLELVIISIMVASEGVEWEPRRMLAALHKMAGQVRFRVGDVVATDESKLREELAAYVKELNTALVVSLPA